MHSYYYKDNTTSTQDTKEALTLTLRTAIALIMAALIGMCC